MKIGLVSPYALPEKGAVSMRMDSFAKYLFTMNHEALILSPFRKKYSADKKYNIRYRSYFELWRNLRKCDAVLLTSPDIKTVFIFSIFLRLNNIPFIVDIRDLAINGHYPWIKSIMEDISLRLATSVTVVTSFMKKYFVKKYGIDAKSIEVLQNGVDRKVFFKDIDSRLKGQLKIPSKSKIILYEGIVGDHDLEDFFDGLDRKKLELYDVYLILCLVVGEVEDESKFKLQAIKGKFKDKGIGDRVRILKNLEPSDLRKYISISDFGLATIPSNEKNLYRIPIKFYEYLACQIPVLAKGPRNGELQKLVEKYSAGIFAYSWKDLFRGMDRTFIKRKNFFIGNDVVKNFDRKESSKKLLKALKKISRTA